MRYIAYRNLIGVSHTEAEAKAEAEEIQVSGKSLDVIMFPIWNFLRFATVLTIKVTTSWDPVNCPTISQALIQMRKPLVLPTMELILQIWVTSSLLVMAVKTTSSLCWPATAKLQLVLFYAKVNTSTLTSQEVPFLWVKFCTMRLVSIFSFLFHI